LNDKKTKRKNGSAGPATPAGAVGGPMDVGMVEKLVRLMKVNDLTFIEVAEGDRRILLKRGGETVTTFAAAPAPQPSAAAQKAAAVEPPNEDEGLIPIKSIMVGTFYAAASPEAPAFVSVGSKINADSDICIIEAMKVFNTIKAECSGTIARVLVTNGQSVEFGQPLFLIKP